MGAGDWSPIITEIVEVMGFKRQRICTNSKRDGTDGKTRQTRRNWR
jgi:hypothetical protein